MFYDYLIKIYGENEPIFVAELEYANMSEGSIRQQIMKLAEEGRIKRYATGIYYIPKASVFKSGTPLSLDRVLEKKYLESNDKRCGYIGGVTNYLIYNAVTSFSDNKGFGRAKITFVAYPSIVSCDYMYSSILPTLYIFSQSILCSE